MSTLMSTFLTVSSRLLQAGVSHQYSVALRDSTHLLFHWKVGITLKKETSTLQNTQSPGSGATQGRGCRRGEVWVGEMLLHRAWAGCREAQERGLTLTPSFQWKE